MFLKRLLAAYRRERYPEEAETDNDDVLAECSGDEFGETVSVDSGDIDRTKALVPDVVDAKQQTEEESDETDDEIRELSEKKKHLEREKETLSDTRRRRQEAREKRKHQLKKEVEILSSEVRELGLKYDRRGPRKMTQCNKMSKTEK